MRVRIRCVILGAEPPPLRSRHAFRAVTQENEMKDDIPNVNMDHIAQPDEPTSV